MSFGEPPWSQIGSLQSDVQALRSALASKVDQHALNSLRETVTSLGHKLNQINETVEPLRHQVNGIVETLEYLQDRVRALEDVRGDN